jgi:transcriptional regulator with XRE-family HTH domain
VTAQKLYAGAKLRETRTRLALTQRAFAEKLGVSLPYLNQMENNNRPVSTAVVLALASEFGFDVTELASGEAERLVADMREALGDPVFGEAPPLPDLRLVASNAPALARSLWSCTAPTGRRMNASPRSTRRWGGPMRRCAPRPGKRCATSSTIATTTSTPSTARPNASRARATPRRRRWRCSTGWG